MNEDAKNQILLVLEMLRRANVENGVSMGFNKSNNSLMFFDTGKYVNTGKFEGFSVSLESLVVEE